MNHDAGQGVLWLTSRNVSLPRSEEHTSELQSRLHLVCRLLLEKKKNLSFPAGWLADKVGKAPVLATAYLTFAAACLVGLAGHGWLALGLMGLLAQVPNPSVRS